MALLRMSSGFSAVSCLGTPLREKALYPMRARTEIQLGSSSGGGGGWYSINYWVGMCHWDSETLSLY